MSVPALEIPLLPARQQQFYISLLGVSYLLRFIYCDAPEGGWIMDIRDGPSNIPIACGIPLVTGHDLLEQYRYLNIGGSMWIATTSGRNDPPSFNELGSVARLIVVPFAV